MKKKLPETEEERAVLRQDYIDGILDSEAFYRRPAFPTAPTSAEMKDIKREALKRFPKVDTKKD